MRYYPLLFSLESVQVMVAGAGSVGLRKVTDVLAASPRRLLWLDPNVSPDVLPDFLCSHPALVYEQRKATPEDVEGCGLVFAATGSREANSAIADYCREHGVPCNVVDDPGKGNFIVPSYFVDGDFILALSTSGNSPALAKTMRRELQEWYGAHYRTILTLLGRLRPVVLALGRKTNDNTEIFRAVVHSGINEALMAGDDSKAAKILEDLLPETLHTHIKDLLHGLY